ncbi:MAG: hypothetical protein CMK71_11220, partial [Pseudomonadaceae bacterium]|nr:hypothetical protein [Pseudomonadaceae bacterium]
MADKWGPVWWGFMHSLAETYPCAPSAAHRRAARRALHAIGALLPCPRCKRHFAEMMRTRPPALRNREALVEWMWGTHNEVNRRLGKVEVSREEAFANVRACGEGGDKEEEGPTGPEEDEEEEGRRRRLWCGVAAAAAAALGVGFVVWR